MHETCLIIIHDPGMRPGIYIHIYMYIYLYVYVCACMRVCVCVCVCMCVCVHNVDTIVFLRERMCATNW